MTVDAQVEWACEVMHDAYERAAVGAGWETNSASRKPWADVPEANKTTMRVAVSALLTALLAADAEAGVRRCWWDEECQEWSPVGEPPS